MHANVALHLGLLLPNVVVFYTSLIHLFALSFRIVEMQNNLCMVWSKAKAIYFLCKISKYE